MPVLIRDIKRTAIPDGMRVTIELDAETSFRSERLENPRRVFFDLRGTRPVPSLLDATLRYSDEIVREIRLGRHPQSTTRIVFDMQGVDSYSVFTLYSPYRLVIDFKPHATSALGPKAETVSMSPPVAAVRGSSRTVQPDLKPSLDADTRALKELSRPPATVVIPPVAVPSLTMAPLTSASLRKLKSEPLPQVPPKPAAARTPAASSPAASSPAPISPVPPSANMDGKFSLARQLGLGVARVVIDAGHGGHDPGAQANGVNESELTLDVATRLSKLLQKQPGVEVVMTRDTDVFVPLEERTSIANREGADLFLSIHANASRNPHARGVETYFLNFASNQDAEAVAARENSASGRAMHSLPDIVKAIALNNKLDESRDFADLVQRSMVKRLMTRNKQLRDLGVKQAPFVVLIGASMPSVLAEISFVTHKQEGQLLKSTAYRQQIAEALFDAVVKYQESLKRPRAGIVGMGAR
jgi:N-acetylmuramoyl-L-alanine amidase